WIPSTSFRQATGSFPRRRNSWSTTSPTDRRHTLLAALSPSPTSTAPSRGIFSAAIGRRVIFVSASPSQRLLARRSNDRHRFWLLNRRQEPVKSIDGRESWWKKETFPSGRRKNSGWVMYEYEMCSSTFETRVLCHVKKSSYQPISGGKFMKSVESTFTEAATETLTGGSSFVGQKRNREESSTLSSAAPKKPCRGLVAHSNGAFQSAPPPTAVVQQLLLAPVVTTLESHLSSIDSVAPNEAGVPAATPSSTDVGGCDVGITAEELEAFDLGKTAEELEAFLASPSSSVDLGGDQHCTDDPFFTREVDALDVRCHRHSLDYHPKASPSGHVDVLLMPDDTRIDSTTVAEASRRSTSSCEQMYCTDGPFFESLEEVHAFLMSDDTFPGASLSSSTGLAAEQMECADNARSITPKELQACLMSDSTTVEKASTSSSDDGLLQQIEAF
ncbi:unnamed protein product, partial [Musa acuminata subsp. burmannicoides]